ncbi:hypothetical protein [Streptomyces hyaluromycini]|uniref:hypothetical protein n=1 Tax=Streptomyces hyaluromycini TaxID=1377993 RepID=UPI0011AE816B|nr:hypothetical protein [Streptomyces hyaluromycini]
MDALVKTIGWFLEKIIQLIILYIWLAIWIVSVVVKLSMLACTRGKADVRVIGWNHSKAAKSLLNEGETAQYVGPGGWYHHYMQNYMSTVAYIYLTPWRVLVVSKNRGCHEFPYASLYLQPDANGGHLGLANPADEVHLGFVSAESIQAVKNARQRAISA